MNAPLNVDHLTGSVATQLTFTTPRGETVTKEILINGHVTVQDFFACAAMALQQQHDLDPNILELKAVRMNNPDAH